MRNFMKIFCLIFVTAYFGACSKQETVQTTLKVNLGRTIQGIAAASAGGVWLRGTKGGESFSMGLQSDSQDVNVNLDKGTWTFDAIAWDGGTAGSPMEGNLRCERVVTDINGNDVTVSLQLNAQKCSINALIGASSKNSAGTTRALRLVSCLYLDGLASGEQSCHSLTEQSGESLSLRVVLKGVSNTPDVPVTPSLVGACINRDLELGGEIVNSEYLTNLRIPISGALSGMPIEIRAYEERGCKDEDGGGKYFSYNYQNGFGGSGNSEDSLLRVPAAAGSLGGYVSLFMADNFIGAGSSPLKAMVPHKLDCLLAGNVRGDCMPFDQVIPSSQIDYLASNYWEVAGSPTQYRSYNLPASGFEAVLFDGNNHQIYEFLARDVSLNSLNNRITFITDSGAGSSSCASVVNANGGRDFVINIATTPSVLVSDMITAIKATPSCDDHLYLYTNSDMSLDFTTSSYLTALGTVDIGANPTSRNYYDFSVRNQGQNNNGGGSPGRDLALGVRGTAIRALYGTGTGGFLWKVGYKTCTSIPTSGQVTRPIPGHDFSFRLNFSAGQRTIPSSMGGNGSNSFEKRVEVYGIENGVAELEGVIEFNCSAALRKVLYALESWDDGDESGTQEFYIDSRIAATMKIDMYSVRNQSSGATSKLFVKVEKDNDSKMRMWATDLTEGDHGHPGYNPSTPFNFERNIFYVDHSMDYQETMISSYRSISLTTLQSKTGGTGTFPWTPFDNAPIASTDEGDSYYCGDVGEFNVGQTQGASCPSDSNYTSASYTANFFDLTNNTGDKTLLRAPTPSYLFINGSSTTMAPDDLINVSGTDLGQF